MLLRFNYLLLACHRLHLLWYLLLFIVHGSVWVNGIRWCCRMKRCLMWELLRQWWLVLYLLHICLNTDILFLCSTDLLAMADLRMVVLLLVLLIEDGVWYDMWIILGLAAVQAIVGGKVLLLQSILFLIVLQSLVLYCLEVWFTWGALTNVN